MSSKAATPNSTITPPWRRSARWDFEGQRWYCRELIHCIVTDGRISELAIYCTGDWDEAVQQRHAEQVRLLRE